MIRVKTMYRLYIMYIDLNMQNLQKKINSQKLIINNTYLTQLNKIKPFIESYINYIDLLNGKIQCIPDEYRDAIKDFTIANMLVKNYYVIYNVLLEYEKQYKELESQKIKYNIYKKVLSKYNYKILKYCVTTGKQFENKYFGALEVRYKEPENVAHKINWKLSNEKRKEILDRGGVPFNTRDSELASLEGREYQGEKWVITGHEQGLLSWRWYPSPLVKEEIKTEPYNFKYVAARGNFGAMSVITNTYKNPNHNYNIYTK